MNMKIRKTIQLMPLLLLLTATVAVNSFGAVYDMHTGTVVKTMPDGTMVTMWGFGLAGSPIQVPGPELSVPAGDTSLTINLTNNLNVPVSIVIGGQTSLPAMSPVWISPVTGLVTGTGSRPAGDYTSRVRSLTHEVSPGNNGSYTWTNLVPGTYLYKSGTHIQVQVPMGLYGAMKKNAVDPDAGVSGEAYPGASFDADQVLLFSEVDPVILDAVVSGTYGTGDLTSTTDYQPGYFLINGEAYESGRSPLPAAPVGQTTLLRFLNAGNLDYTPVIHSPLMDVIAEDGKPYPFTRKQYSIPLVAGKTLDALLTPTEVGSIPIYDRALHLSNAAQYPGGMRIYLDVPDAPPGFAVTYPNGGEGLSRGSAYDITWSYQGDPGPFVRIELWRADGAGTLTTRQAVLAPSAPIGSAGAGSFSWRIIPRIPSTTYKIKIISTTDGLITDESDNIFNIN